jgi:hypothetical protein
MKMPHIKWSDKEKKLCQEQENLINNHIATCSICKASFDSYNKNFGIASTPPCNQFTSQMKDHISKCQTCNQANKKWNDDAISTTPEMRSISNKLGKGIMPSKMELENLTRDLKEKLGVKDDGSS